MGDKNKKEDISFFATGKNQEQRIQKIVTIHPN
jgi:hypothetical protein